MPCCSRLHWPQILQVLYLALSAASYRDIATTFTYPQTTPDTSQPIRDPLRTTPATMKFSIALAIVVFASLNAEVATARCFTSGIPPSRKEEARGWASDACRKNGGMFTGNYAPGQTKAMCPETTRQGLDPSRYARKVKFEVQNLNKNTGFDLGDDDCYNKLVSEINSCTYGGETITAGWRFR